MTDLRRWAAVLTLGLGGTLGCGGGGGGGGGTPDAGMTSPDGPPAPTVGPCSVKREGPSVAVVFHDADGQPLATVQTDVSGVAMYDQCVPDGMVTVINPVATANSGLVSKLMTVQGVQVGDQVVFDPPPDGAGTISSVTVTVQNAADGASVSPDPTKYTVTLGDCTSPPVAIAGATGDTIQVDTLAGCQGDTKTNLAAVSISHSSGGAIRGFARADSSSSTTPVTASGGTWVSYGGPTLVGLSNPPAGAASAFLVVSPLIDGVFYNRDYKSFSPTATTVDAAYWPDAIVDEQRIALSMSFGNGIFTSTRMHVATAPSQLDLSDVLFAPPSHLIVDVTTPTRPQLGWQDGDPRAVLTRSELDWTDGPDVGTWIVVVPGNPGKTVVPVLPDAYVGLGPKDTATFSQGQLYLADKGIPYATWLGQGLSTASYAENGTPPEVFGEAKGMTFRMSGYAP